jgi:hypothetical protein
MPKRMTDKWLVTQAIKTNSITDDVIKAVRNEYEKMYNVIGEKGVNKIKFQGIIDDLFGGIKKEAQSIVGFPEEGLDDIAKEVSASIGDNAQSTIANVKKVKDIVQKEIPESTWLKGKKMKALTLRERKLTDAYFRLKDLIYNSLDDAADLMNLDERATEIYRVTKAVKRMVVDETGKPYKTSQLINTFSGKGTQAGKRKLFERLAELDVKTRDIIKNMNRYSGRRTMRRMLGRIAKGGLVAAGGAGAFKLFGGGR